MNTRSFLLRAALSVAVLACVSCVGQQVTKANGDKYQQVTVLARSKITDKSNGDFSMSANAERAVEGIEKVGDKVITGSLIGKGIDGSVSTAKKFADKIK